MERHDVAEHYRTIISTQDGVHILFLILFFLCLCATQSLEYNLVPVTHVAGSKPYLDVYVTQT